MEKITLFTRKYNKESYEFILNKPDSGELGVLGLPIKPYISIKTTENSFGYNDTILFDNGVPYTLYRYTPNWILKAAKNAIIKKGLSEYIK